ncbi:class I SAM-dependent methyltransferase [Leptolyngbya sp. AN03gr2]|uniref:class I SAM-dependent methyltransferase n=1 Tax=unclassified Leptolyngbya TaxID=2650499 RepID=UPI003D320584
MISLKGLLNSLRSGHQKQSEDSAIDSATPYIYRPDVPHIDFATGVKHFKSSGRAVVEHGVENTRPKVVANVIELGKQIGIEFSEFSINVPLYNQYFNQAEYAKRYAEYYRGNQPEKTLEHFICYSLLEMNSDDIFVDLASEHSPVPEIFGRLSGATTYSQDIMYPAGIEGNRIGGDACAMPVSDGFMTKAALTCSLEHFEQDGDTRLFQELARVLKRGGKICVVPFYVFDREAVQTDPTVSVPANVSFDPDATIYCAPGWGNRHGRFYSPQSFMQRIIRPVQNQFKFEFFYLKNAAEVDPSVYARFAFTATRL